MDFNEYRQAPHLYDALLGIPRWARFFRYANNLNSLVAIGFGIYLWVAQSLWSGIGYLAIFFISLWIATTMTAASRVNMTTMIVVSTVGLVAINGALVWWFLGS